MSEIRVDRFKAEDGISAPQFPNGIHVTGVVTATVLNGTVPYLTVGSNAQAGASGIVTAKGADINGDIDVDGHTNLDNVSIAGVTTTTENIIIDADNKKLQIGDGQDIEVYHDGTYSYIQSQGTLFIDSTGDINFRNPSNNEYKAAFNNNGACTLNHNGNAKLSTTSTGISVTGDVSAATGTFTGNVTVGGVLTYEDVTNIDSVGIVTARLGLRVPDNVYSYFGTGNDLSIRHDASGGSHSYIFNHGSGVLKIGSDTQILIGKTSNETYFEANPDGNVKLYHDNSPKVTTSSTGATVTGTISADAADIDDFVSVGSNIHLGNAGIITATSFVGNGANLTGIVAIPTGAIMAWPTESIPSGFLKCQGQAIARSTYSDLFSAIGVIYGAGDGSSTFNIPDYRGEFLRGRAEGSGNDPDRGSRTNRGDGNGGDNVGTKQDYAVVNHSHGNNSGGNSHYGYNTNSNNTGQFSKSGHGYYSNQSHSGGIVHSMSYGTNYANVNGHVTNNEVRPRNVYVHWIIKT